MHFDQAQLTVLLADTGLGAPPLCRQFFEQPTVDVARGLIGCLIKADGYMGMITETEAYVGQDDPACHAAKGRTPRTQVMFGPAGFIYIYFIYGLYYCLNIVTEATGYPAAVLIRGIMFQGVDYKHTNGPGKLCRFLKLNSAYNNQDLIGHRDLTICAAPQKIPTLATPRIGISKGQDKLWRFIAV